MGHFFSYPFPSILPPVFFLVARSSAIYNSCLSFGFAVFLLVCAYPISFFLNGVLAK
ncbi:MAG: hypothetical protein J3R72DRAFT_438149 [Linnemannia gamsii]|nr:MAG: hypothetical protein J3R72DRAFT_438149 [Linnemannia gamsii]